MIENLKNWWITIMPSIGLAPVAEKPFENIPKDYAGLHRRYIELGNENTRLGQHVKQLQSDIVITGGNAGLYSSFSYDECKAMVRFFYDWREAKHQDYQETVRIINSMMPDTRKYK